jgi:hypothetical protein
VSKQGDKFHFEQIKKSLFDQANDTCLLPSLIYSIFWVNPAIPLQFIGILVLLYLVQFFVIHGK